MMCSKLAARHSRLLVACLVIGLLLLPGRTPSAAAHPLGNFTVNLYSRLDVGAEQVGLTYIVDMAEIPTYQEFGGNLPAAGEQQAYAVRKAAELRRGIRLSVDGRSPDLRLGQTSVRFPSGQGGLSTTRIELRLVAALSRIQAGARHDLSYEDTNFADRLGWHEIVVRPAATARIIRSDAPASDATDELRVYPQDMLRSPLDVRSAHAVVALGPGPSSAPQSPPPTEALRSTDRFAALVATEQLSPAVLAIALLLALGLGALHALSPGHGKTIVGAYLIGARGTARHALFLGLTVTVTHTIGVFALGLITLYASRYILPEQLYPWLGILSGGLVVAMGLTLFTQRVRTAIRNGADDQHHHDHAHDHAHHHGHTHGSHTHLPPAGDGASISWRSLLALGVSGGLIPCPSALLVMLSAISLGRIGFGLLLIVAFSLGLAAALTSVGLLFVYGGRWLARAGRGRRQIPGVRLIPVAGAMVVTTAGVLITAQAAIQAGLLR